MRKMSDKEFQLHVRAVALLLLAMVAVAMLGEVSRQNWNSKVTAYPTKTEEAIESYARDLMSKMTLEQKVAQMFIASDGVDAETAAALGLGSVHLTTAQLEHLTADDVTALVRGYEAEGKIPMLVAVSEEGGTVNTVSAVPALRAKAFLSPRELLTTGGLNLVDSDARDKSDLLRGLGIHVNFAPVCDVAEYESAMMYERAAKGDAEDVGRYVETVVTAMNERKVIGVLKYFPGYGNAKAMEHTEVLTDRRTMEQLETIAFLPFAAGIEAGAEMVMMSNTIVAAVDGGQPASLSPHVHKLLRRQLGFDGIIVSGDLQAKGLERYGDSGELAVMAIKAGSDLVFTADYAEQIKAVVRSVKQGEISEERIEESVLRILEMKIAHSMMG